MIRTLSLIIIVSPFFFCATKKDIKSKIMQGRVSTVKRIFSQSKLKEVLPDYTPDANYWYSDSLFIQENTAVDIYTNHVTNEETWQKVLMGYTFVDLKTKSFYDYLSFSDTAKLVKQYTQPDSIQGTIWNFWASHPLFDKSIAKQIEDTVINNVIYQRYFQTKYFKNEKKQLDSFYHIAYLKCKTDKPKMFTFDIDFSVPKGCPMVREDAFGVGQPYVISEIRFLADTLTEKEKKVFKAWEKYAKKNPVHK